MSSKTPFRRAMVQVSVAAAILFGGSARAENSAILKGDYVLPDTPLAAFQNAKLSNSIANDRKVLLGSIGSDLWHGADDPSDEFWMITDRGPNGQIAVNTENRRTFAVPEFNPAILKVKAVDGAIRILDTIPIVTRSGKPVTGMPNMQGRDETPYDYSGQKTLPLNPNGLDSEGLVRTRAGDFWVVDEYGPSLLKIAPGGKVVKRYVPKGLGLKGTDYDVAEALPGIFAKRKINRGFEGIAMSPDEKTLYLALQSPLLNPDKKTGDRSRQTRFLAFDVAAEKITAEYVYRFDDSKEFDPAHSAPDEMKVSSLVAIAPGTLLVVERTDWVAKIYRVELSAETNVLGTHWDDPGISPALEALNDASADYQALAKTLVVDLSKLSAVPEKIEGLAVLDATTIVVSNDNDFDIGDFDAQGNNVGKRAKNRILVIKLPAAQALQVNTAEQLTAELPAR
jgi:Esterase-like activity of phytase